MNPIIKNNNLLLRTKRLFKKERTFLSLKEEYLKAATGTVDLKTASSKELLLIREKVLEYRKKEQLILVMISLMVLFLCLYVIFQIMKQDESIIIRQQTVEFKEKEKEFLTFIEDGDEWFKKGHWQNSIFFYEKAKQHFSNNYDINYRLVRSYSLQCESYYKNCHQAKELLNELFIQFPNKETELLEIKNRLEYEY